MGGWSWRTTTPLVDYTDGVLDVHSWDDSSSTDPLASQLPCVRDLSCPCVMLARLFKSLRAYHHEEKDLDLARDRPTHVMAGHRLGRTISLLFSEPLLFGMRKHLPADVLACDIFIRDLLSFRSLTRLSLPSVFTYQISTWTFHANLATPKQHHIGQHTVSWTRQGILPSSDRLVAELVTS